MTATRGPQVVLEGYARDVARGGGGRTMRANMQAMDQLVSAGLVADGNAVDGSSRTGGQPYDPVVAQFPHAPVSAWEVPAPLLSVDLSASGGPFLPLGGGIMGGMLTLAGNASLPLHGVPLQQVQASFGYSLMQGLQPAGGFTSSPYPFGTMNTATALSCQICPPLSGGRPVWPQVQGFWNASSVATYNDRGFVTFYAGANSATPTTITVATANYTATTMVPSPALTAPQVAFIQQAIAINNQRAPLIPPPFDNVGMMIDTQHTTKYTGNITAVAADGSSVTVQGWYQMGNQAAGQVPPNAVGAYINPCTKMWNINGVSTLDAASVCNQMAFIEGDVYNNQASYSGIGTTIPTIGVSMNGNSANTNGYAYIALGNWYTGFLSRANQSFGFLIQPDAARNPPFGFVSQVRSDIAGGHHPFAYFDSVSSQYRWSVTSNGGMNLGANSIENGLAVSTASAGSQPSIQAVGVDTNVTLVLRTKGTAPVQIGLPAAQNGVAVFPVASGSQPSIQAAGVDPNITMVLQGKGTGQVLVQSNLSVTGNAGFNSVAPIAKPTIAGACAGNTAIKALLTALASYGLVTDTTTA